MGGAPYEGYHEKQADSTTDGFLLHWPEMKGETNAESHAKPVTGFCSFAAPHLAAIL